MSFYGSDLARIHDEGFGHHARAAAATLIELLGDRRGQIVELGCGSGISCEQLTAAGFDVLGIDISEEMLAIARRRAPDAEFRQGSIWDAELPPCLGVTAIGEVINYAADERAGAGRLPELLGRVRAALKPGGVFLLDFATPGRARLGVSGQSAGPHWEIDYEAHEDGEAATLERRSSFVVDGRAGEESHLLRLYDSDLVRSALEDAGFEPRVLETYGATRFPAPGYAAFAASAR